MPTTPGILLTAFEPSGDALAAAWIEVFRQHQPAIPVWAMGGPRMAAAGAQIIEETTSRAVMGTGAIGHVRAHHARIRRLAQAMRGKPLLAHLPVDSPAANWAICKLVRRTQPTAKIIHLAAPQLWAWAPWRIRKMRRLSDHVLCLLPFEPAWFASRGMPATFVGHPMFEVRDATTVSRSWPDGEAGARLALLPGSRSSEIDRNWPTMLAVWRALSQRHPTLTAVVAAANDSARMRLERHRDFVGRAAPERLSLATACADQVLAWSDAVLVVSGTATLQVARHRKPMAVVYNASRLIWHVLGRWVIDTRTFSLPNIISESQGLGRAVPEFVPHFGDAAPIIEATESVLFDSCARERIVAALDAVCAPFAEVSFGEASYQATWSVIQANQ